MGAVLEDRKIMQLHAWSAKRLATETLPGPSAVLRIADDPSLLPGIYDEEQVWASESVICCDTEPGSGICCEPTREHARKIYSFYQESLANGIPNFVAQCLVGVGRSVAVCMALNELAGNPRTIYHPTYNRTLYSELLLAGGEVSPVEPLVSLAVRVKYDAERMLLFLLSLRRQRYTNWEVVFFTDGYDSDAPRTIDELWREPRARIIHTDKKLGHWGHPHRQAAFEQCRGEWIGTQNDDNYLTPGFIEQLVNAAEEHGANIALCQPLHRYSAWKPTSPGSDLCTWIARKELIQQVPWTGWGFEADREYLESLMALPESKVVAVNRPLVVKN